MKIMINKIANFKFSPFEVVVRVENIRDLEAIASLTNASHSDMAKFLNKNKWDEDCKDFNEDEEAVREIMDICGAVVNR